MTGRKPPTLLSGLTGDPRFMNRAVSLFGHLLVFFAILAASYIIMPRLGTTIFLALLILTVVGCVYAYFSFKSLILPFLLWFLAVGGFRFIWTLKTPLLPDLYVDRLFMIWLVMVFLIKFVAGRKTLRGPFLLDGLILAHGLYIWVRIVINDNSHFHIWSQSYLIPYSAYFLAKNILTDSRKVRIFLGFMMVVLVYYEITSIAEKFSIAWLTWPKYILSSENRWAGRSGGPFLHGPLFGTVLGIMLPVHMYFLATVAKKWLRLGLYISLLLCFAGLYFTYTRGAWLAGIVALGTTVYLNRRHFFRIVAPALILAPILGIGILGMGQDTFLKERATNENTISGRLGTAVTALRMFKAHPFFGVGFFEFRFIQKDYVKPVDLPIVGTIKSSAMMIVPIHDIYLGPLAEDGLVGALLQASIYLVIFRTFRGKYRKRRKGDHFEWFILPILGGIFAGYLFGGLAIDYRFFSIVGTLFYISAAILYGQTREEDIEVGISSAATSYEDYDNRW